MELARCLVQPFAAGVRASSAGGRQGRTALVAAAAAAACAAEAQPRWQSPVPPAGAEVLLDGRSDSCWCTSAAGGTAAAEAEVEEAWVTFETAAGAVVLGLDVRAGAGAACCPEEAVLQVARQVARVPGNGGAGSNGGADGAVGASEGGGGVSAGEPEDGYEYCSVCSLRLAPSGQPQQLRLSAPQQTAGATVWRLIVRRRRPVLSAGEGGGRPASLELAPSKGSLCLPARGVPRIE